MRPSIHDTDQPHHVVEMFDEIGKVAEHCKCGYVPHERYNFRLVKTLVQHIRDNFDGRCHFKRYKMECIRFYGHRGIHKCR